MPKKASSTTNSKKTTTRRSTKTTSEELSGVIPLANEAKVDMKITTKKTRTRKVKTDPDLNSSTLKQILGGIDDDLGFGLSNFAFAGGNVDDLKSVTAEIKSSKKAKTKSPKLGTSLWKLGIAANVAGDSISSAIEDFYNIYKQNTTKPPLGYAEAVDNSIFGQYRNRDGGFKYLNNWTNIYKNYNEPDTKIPTLELHNKYLKLFDH
ncbi:hypothetical protein RUS47_01770 [Mycoplasmoides gallisepticum]|uniref:Uncharacterized protein n=3 Tax=Mycoplasmoides gallisepticum TaxID=2096 RepID=Q7NBF3_MYCGA|nr:hypothetical protein [Mycoplasmoides gallisepticum]AAP56676.2 unique hypothetical protein [Mycoplasmoides gallisepticum str. R(low)]ADC30524.1 hypothetical protein MGAH_1215 [Mycoplasmoides gallisepticum str. R(high)]AFP75926.1 hypothetical protein HFMG94VAA_2606 [Mycoplasmoides gallisepticum VA94_7994-1-7P]AFP76693.1 hypothetical protein HFMG95NCA_2533 [Mycoplasmoides gallisepticum NC95_13295-2-2P]AFP77447.1 hypothetical protein HFMG96NCA_2532 [Mycoplasmoides gallisepticum NC96_1596-4-2P]